MDSVLDIDKKPEDIGPRSAPVQDALPDPTSLPPQQTAGNQAMQTLLRPNTPAPASPQKLNQEEEQGAPTSPEQEQRWASEFAGDEARLVGILTSLIYTEDDEAQVISILSRWAMRQTPDDRKASNAAAQGLEGIHSIHFGLRSSYLDRLLEKLRQTQVWTRTGRTTAYEAMFQRFDPQNVSQVRGIRDRSSIKFVGREELADERKEEDLSAEGIIGWQSNKFEAAAPSRDPADERRADWVIDYLEHTPPNKMTPELTVLSEAISHGDGKALLLQRSHVVTAGDRLRFAREIAGRLVVTGLEYAMWEIGAGAVEAVVPELFEGAAGAETAGAAGRTEGEGRAALQEGSAARSEVGSAAAKDVEPYVGEPGTHLSVKDAQTSAPTPPTETSASVVEAPTRKIEAGEPAVAVKKPNTVVPEPTPQISTKQPVVEPVAEPKAETPSKELEAKEPEAPQETEAQPDEPGVQTEESSQLAKEAQQAADKEQRLAEIKQDRGLLEDKLKKLDKEIKAAEKKARQSTDRFMKAKGNERVRLQKNASYDVKDLERLNDRRRQIANRISKLYVEEGRLLRPASPTTWQEAEQYLREEFGGQKQTLDSGIGERDIDCFTPDGISRESKFGEQKLDDFIQREIDKDVALMKSGKVKSTEWHFYRNSQTGAGPNGPLARALDKAGIKIVPHY